MEACCGAMALPFRVVVQERGVFTSMMAQCNGHNQVIL